MDRIFKELFDIYPFNMKKASFLLITFLFLLNCKSAVLVVSKKPEIHRADTNLNLIQIKSGSFDMGSKDSEQKRRGDEVFHNVKLEAFYFSKDPVSQKEYYAVMRNSHGSGENINEPIDNVSWYDAVNYCNELSIREKLTPVYMYRENTVIWNNAANGYRLLTEAEWEYACKTDSVSFFSVSEWCWDWYGEYDLENLTNPQGPGEGLLNQKVVRGYTDNESIKDPSARFYINSSVRMENLGFRVARSTVK
ncbi:MAG: formylglycine-generating enzyme family protein [Treponema sp.]|nr:formylglycine-generating enzyme family protein [Treponema sp.]